MGYFCHHHFLFCLVSSYGSRKNGSQFRRDRIMSCLLKHFIRKIKIKVNRRFDVSNIILKIEVVYANVLDVM